VGNYVHQGVACYVAPGPRIGFQPLHGAIRKNKHFYTANNDELNRAVAAGEYSNIGVVAFVATRAVAGAVPLLRGFNEASGSYFYTTNQSEMKKFCSDSGFKYQGIACWVSPRPGAGLIPLYRAYSADDADFALIANEREARALGEPLPEKALPQPRGLASPSGSDGDPFARRAPEFVLDAPLALGFDGADASWPQAFAELDPATVDGAAPAASPPPASPSSEASSEASPRKRKRKGDDAADDDAPRAAEAKSPTGDAAPADAQAEAKPADAPKPDDAPKADAPKAPDAPKADGGDKPPQ